MLKKIATALLCTVAPSVLTAQKVELRSSDGLISVKGEVIAFDGVLLTVATSVGEVNVPASDVGCYGFGCLTILSDAALNIPPNTFAAVVIDDVPAASSGAQPTAAAADPAPAAVPVSETLSIGFSDPRYADMFRTSTGAFVLSGQRDTRIGLTLPGQIELTNADRQEDVSVIFANTTENADIAVAVTPLTGAAEFVHQSPADWSLTGPLSHQLLGLDAFEVVVAEGIGLEAITLAQLAGIYAGDVTNWSELGGADLRILPLQLPASSGLHSEFSELVVAPSGKTVAKSVLTIPDEVGIVNSVTRFPGSIAVVSFGQADDSMVIPVAGGCDVAVAATPFSITSGDYPLIRPITATYAGPPRATLMPELLDHAATRAAQAAVAGQGFLDASPMLQEAAANNNRVVSVLDSALSDIDKPAAAKMFELLFDADRLSPTLIGGAVSGPEGAWNRAAFVALADALGDASYAGKEILFIGFAESANGDQAAIDVSERVANEMQAAFGLFAPDVIAENVLSVSAYGFGGVAPAACYQGQVDSETNSRVEIWVR
ncbi:substrate-binding domain-containing protein [Yoonia sediminilitoris]|uniref:Periplasmic binding family protein n=1 Tax=Yoonia sediminilitoris TaxID=1286148 RepID=A0A2T6KKG6_9RHOB|nr:substrate-binding domain-containing protein [Yoonia sediminilitoris]PUB16457.1 periplasmic binding family protein [Yoonia sediminilitoris]RCW96806.1 periplasmic binding family protein [Yoonia sediminilitoris]